VQKLKNKKEQISTQKPKRKSKGQRKKGAKGMKGKKERQSKLIGNYRLFAFRQYVSFAL